MKKIGIIAAGGFAAATAAAVFLYPGGMTKGVLSGLSLCATNVIPSLFLFTVITVFAVKSGMAAALGSCVSLPARLFSLSGEEFSVFLMSLISGYPVGARLIAGLYADKKTDRETAESMLCFCVNAGPAFIIIACGEGVFGSFSVGIKLFAAHISASVIIALFTAPARSCRKVNKSAELGNMSLCDAFVLSVSGAAEAILSVSAYVVFFAGIGGMVAASPLPERAADILIAFFEVTKGVTVFSESPLSVAFLLGFGGISVQLQVMSASRDIKPRFLKVFLSRICHGALSSVIFAVIGTVTAENTDAEKVFARSHGSPFSALAFLLLAAVMLFFIRGKKEIRRAQVCTADKSNP